MEFLVVFDCLWFQREPCLLSAVCEDLEAALLGGRVVAAGSGQDGPFPLVLQLPDVGDVGGPHLPGGGQRGRGRGGRGPCSWLWDRRRLAIPDHLVVVFGDHLGHVGHGAV